MPKHDWGEYLKTVGVSFIEFLKEDDQRRSITDQKQLKQIYTNEFRLFRVRNGYKHPDFGPVLHALNSSGKAKISSGNIYFKGAQQVCLDQQQQQETSSQDKGPGTANGQTNHSQDKPQTAGKAGKKKNKVKTSSVTVTSDPEPKEGLICLTVNDDTQVCLDQQQQQETSSQDKGPGTANGQTNHSQDKPQTGGKAGKKKNKVKTSSVTVTSDPEPKEGVICLTVNDDTQVCLDQQQQQETPSQDKGPGTANGQTNHSQDKPQTGGKAGKKKNKVKTSSVTVTSDPEPKGGLICLTVTDDTQVVPLCVNNRHGGDSIHFTLSMDSGSFRCFTLRGDHGFNKDTPVILGPGEICEIDVHFHTTQPGVYRAFLQFKIEHPDRPIAGVCIVRSLEVTYRTSLGQELTQTSSAKACSIPPETSYVPTIVKGQRPERLPNMNLKPEVPLKEYNVPDYIDKLMKALNGIIAGSSIGKLSRDKVMVESPLTWKNYSQKLHLLLFLEEVQLERDMKKYNMVDVPLVRDEDDTKLFLLQVSDSDASLLRGQQVLVRPSEEPEDPEGVRYQGFIHHVDEDQAQLSFGKEFMDRFIEGMTFSVEFVVNRLTMRVEHRAVEFASLYSLKEVLFPAEDPISYKSKKTSTPSLFNSQLKENREQYQAIKHIVAGSSIPAPYLVFGPPGTGKTVTVVEAILQIERKQASCHILACAPSNSAADLLWGRLLDGMEDKDKDKVFRMYAYSHSGVIPQKRQRYCNKKTGSIVIPSKEELMQYKIMVTTLQTASRLVTGGIPTGFYTHIFVDEAGCAPETTCIIPLSGLLNPETGQVVLAGDPKQLGPIIHSCLADKYGMGVSLLERLMSDVPLYKKKMKKDKGERFNKRFITKLLKNYRSHPDILKIPNDLFYEGELQFCADEKMRNSYCGWKYLPMKDFPVIFHRVVGTNEQEADSPSLFNIAEVEVLMDYLKILVCGQRKTKPRNIGIIATYRKQVEKIKKALEIVEKDLGGKNLEDIMVGTVEEFQGKESQVILLSTVRSRPKGMIKKNQKISLGFVKNDKRFNVAMSRAQALLIVVGDPTVLSTDSTWDRFIQYCTDKGGYCELP